MNLCIDLGATNIRFAFVNGKKVINKNQIKNPRKKKEILSILYKTIPSYKNVSSISISIAGFESKGKIQGARNMDFNSVPLRSLLKRKFSIPIYIENDADCAGLAEFYYGHGKNRKNFILLTLGTGIGGSVFINGKLDKGTNNAAGEVGGMLIEGKKFESIASGTGSLNVARSLGFKKISSLELEKKANKGNKRAKEVYKKVGYYLGLGLLNLSYALDPEVIILGGGFAKVKHIYPSLKKTLYKNYDIKRKIPILHAKLGDDASLIGASLIRKE